MKRIYSLKLGIILGIVLSFGMVHGAVTFTTVCFGVSNCFTHDGSILITATGGTTPYMYSINCGLTWQSSYSFNGLHAGAYEIEVKDALNDSSVCVAITVGYNDPIIYTTSITNVTCNTCSDGRVIVMASGGGGGGYLYSKNCGITFGTPSTFNNLTSGWFHIQVKNGYDCITNCDSVYVGSPAGMNEINTDAEMKVYPNPATTTITIHSQLSILNSQLSTLNSSSPMY